MPLDLLSAQRHAEKLCDWLRPHCCPLAASKIFVAGSIRRERPFVNDIDLVCIPKVTEQKDLLGNVIARQNHMLDFLQHYLQDRNPHNVRATTHPHFISGGAAGSALFPKQALVWLPKIQCQVDLWFAEQETLATRLLMRTGSKEHNIWLAMRAQDQGGTWNPYEGVTINGVAIPGPFGRPGLEEENIYAALQLKFIEPKNREQAWLDKQTASALRL